MLVGTMDATESLTIFLSLSLGAHGCVPGAAYRARGTLERSANARARTQSATFSRSMASGIRGTRYAGRGRSVRPPAPFMGMPDKMRH